MNGGLEFFKGLLALHFFEKNKPHKNIDAQSNPEAKWGRQSQATDDDCAIKAIRNENLRNLKRGDWHPLEVKRNQERDPCGQQERDAGDPRLLHAPSIFEKLFHAELTGLNEGKCILTRRRD